MTEFRNRNQFKSFGHLYIGNWELIWVLGFGIWDFIVWRTIHGKDGSSF